MANDAREAIAPVYDKTGREIMIGDVLKVYHFTGARRKRHYMYKQVIDQVTLGKAPPNQGEYLFVSHLAMKERGQRDDGFHICLNGQILTDYEIVQGLDAYWQDRPRITLPPLESGAR